jgi:hypothetical protein
MRCRYNLHFSWWGLSIDAKMASIVSGLQLALDFMAIFAFWQRYSNNTIYYVLYVQYVLISQCRDCIINNRWSILQYVLPDILTESMNILISINICSVQNDLPLLHTLFKNVGRKNTFRYF